MIKTLKEIGTTLRTHGKESNPFWASLVPTVFSLDNGDTITNLYDIANTFNVYFASIAETMKRSIKYSHKHISDYLSN